MLKKIMANAIVTADLKESISFYRDKLGLKLRTESETFADFEIEGTTIALLDKSVASDLAGEFLNSNFKQSRPLILAWESVEDVNKLYLELKTKGVEFIIAPKSMPWGQIVAYFQDPDGNIWEISQ